MSLHTFHIFKAGHYSNSGFEKTWTEADIKNIALSYSETLRPAPLTVNHPPDDQPILGKVKKLIAKGPNLYAAAEVSEALKNMVRSRSFRGVSSSFIKPESKINPTPGYWFLKHVGFLNQINPVVKDLEHPAFAEMPIDAAAFGLLTLRPVCAEFGEQDEQAQRQRLHQAVLQQQQRRPGLSYAGALARVQEMGRQHAHAVAFSESADPDMAARHRLDAAAIDFMSISPEVSYAEAVATLADLF